MSIDLTTERLLSLSQAAKLLPYGRRGRPTHPSTLIRWIVNGVRDQGGNLVRLEAVRLGGRWLVTAEGLGRFAQRLTPELANPSPPTAPDIRRRHPEPAERVLDRLGF